MMKLFLRWITLLSIALFFFGCPRSGRIRSRGEPVVNTPQEASPTQDTGKTVVKMTKINGVYEIPMSVNGIEMYFIFDTGASTISISETEAIFLYKQGKLTSDDITGSEQYTDATGAMSEGTLINLKTVKIGNRVLENIQASVVHNLQAPLLFGQSALGRFGKVSIDYQKMEISFEQ